MEKTMTNRELMKAEALDRLRFFKLHPNVIREFENDEHINISECGGLLYWANDEEQEVINRIENKYDCVVYHGIKSSTDFGELLSLLVVMPSDVGIGIDREEYEFERKFTKDGLKDGYVFSYVVNKTYPDCSELGDIVVKSLAGGLVRVG